MEKNQRKRKNKKFEIIEKHITYMKISEGENI